VNEFSAEITMNVDPRAEVDVEAVRSLATAIMKNLDCDHLLARDAVRDVGFRAEVEQVIAYEIMQLAEDLMDVVASLILAGRSVGSRLLAALPGSVTEPAGGACSSMVPRASRPAFLLRRTIDADDLRAGVSFLRVRLAG